MRASDWCAALGLPKDMEDRTAVQHGVGTVVFYVLLALGTAALLYGARHA